MTEAVKTAARVEVFARPTSRINNETARSVYEVASSLPKEERNAEGLLAVAQSPDSPIHHAFTWDDAEAARLHRLEQARYLLRSVQVRVVEEDRVLTRPAFYSVKIDEDRSRPMSYVRYSEATEDTDLVERILASSKRDLAAFKQRYDKHHEVLRRASPQMAEILALADELLEG